ncbi:MAG: pilus assembly PilX N-terminal domain-containing protein [Candidatus Omnitrophota bacterium]|jgi:hypothetical protein
MNNRGIALILSYVVIMVLTIFATAFIARTVSDTNLTARYMDSTKAFWVAEAGLNQAYYNYKKGIAQPVGPVELNPGGGTYTIDAANPMAVKVTGTFGRTSAQRILRASFITIPAAFQNTLSIGRHLRFTGSQPTALEVDGKTRLSGRLIRDWRHSQRDFSFYLDSWFEDYKEGVSVSDTTLGIPDYNHNGRENEYDDFVQMGRQIVDTYPTSEVIYIKTNGEVLLSDISNISGKKIIFVEGRRENYGGDVTISHLFAPALKTGDDLTVISTNSVTYYLPWESLFPENAHLNIICWGVYRQPARYFQINPRRHYSELAPQTTGKNDGIIYTHDWADWGLASGKRSITGNIIVNRDLVIDSEECRLDINYSDRIFRGDIPPGFKWLFGAGEGPKYIVDWQEAE